MSTDPTGSEHPRAKYTNAELAEALAEGLTKYEIAQRFGVSERSVYKRIQNLRRRGEFNADGNVPGHTPGEGMRLTRVGKQVNADGRVTKYTTSERPIGNDEAHIDPDSVKGGRRVRLSTFRDRDGEIVGQWDIRVYDKETEDYLAFLDALNQKVQPLPPVDASHLKTVSEIAVNIVLSDCHIGSLSWAPETGADWDLRIAEEMLTKSFMVMIDESPEAHRCVLTLLGDWLHYDKPDPVTTLSGNILSADGRQEKMVDVAIRVMRRIMAYALTKFEHVTLLVAEGNHDLISSMWLRKMFKALYEQEPRVDVIDSPFPFYALTVGEVFLGYQHGHLRGIGGKATTKQLIKNAEQLVAIFADEFAEMWGATTKRYIHTGHFHSKVEVEPRGAQVIQHPTLQARDDYAARNGWASLRGALGICYHGKFGEKSRVTISPEMLL